MLGWVRHLWIVQDPVAFWVRATPEICLKTVEQAIRPSVKRLHLRETFANGRRYDITRDGAGFRLSSSATSLWQPRQRISAACVMNVRLDTTTDSEQTTLTLIARLRPYAIFNALWIPAMMVYLIGGNPWPRPLIIGILCTLFTLSWASMRLTAAVDAAEMTYFLQKTFEELRHIQPVQLPSPVDDGVIRGSDFDVMWERFVQSQQQEHAD